MVPPHVVKSIRGRYRHSGARSDQSDAYVLADLLRTDRPRLQPWQPDSLLTQRIRAQVSLLTFLTHTLVRFTNRLCAALLRYYPVALEIFSDLGSQTALAFIQHYPTPQAVAELTFTAFQAFAQQCHYTQPQRLKGYWAQLQQPHSVASPETVLVYQAEAVLLATLLLQLIRTKQGTLRELETLFRQHPDAAIFESLPEAGKFLAPALIAHFGDDRRRFPTVASLQALAGTCPITDSSGKRKRIKFRRACNREFRQIAQQWARRSCPESVWATAYFNQVRARAQSDNHAYRCLANRWLAIAWKLWQTHQVYDEAYHLKQRALRSQPLD